MGKETIVNIPVTTYRKINEINGPESVENRRKKRPARCTSPSLSVRALAERDRNRHWTIQFQIVPQVSKSTTITILFS